MPQSLSSVHLHLTFSTKARRPFLADPRFRSEMHSYLGAISGRLECPTVVVGGVEDHVHVLAQLGRKRTQSEWVKELKRVSSLWAKSRVAEFSWQSGYGVFSVGPNDVATVRKYIERQEEHHRKYSFQDEFLRLLKDHQMAWDDRYLWE